MYGLRRRLLFASLALLTGSACRTTEPGVELVHLVVLHTNDVHGQVQLHANGAGGGLARVAAYVARVRAEERGPRTAVLVLDGGDWCQGTPEGQLDGGAGFLRALVAVGYDAMALGNHELDLGLVNLEELLRSVDPPAVAANLRDPVSGARVGWIAPWRVVEAAGLEIALVGLLTTETPRITHPEAAGLLFTDPVAELAQARAELRGAADLVIPIGHIGVEEGERLAAAFPDLPLVVTGHSHTYLEEGRRVGRTLVVQAGEKATVVGRVDLWLDPGTLVPVESRARLERLADPDGAHRNPVVDELAAELARRGDEHLGDVIGELASPLTRGRGPNSTVAGNWIADLMRARAVADVALHNRGGTRRDLPAGPITRRDLYELLPFDNDIVTLVLDGATLLEVLRRSVEARGPGALDVSGLELRLRARGDECELVRVAVDGHPLDPLARYTVATNSFLARGGDGYDELARAEERRSDPILLRELALEAFQRERVIAPPADERIRLLEP